MTTADAVIRAAEPNDAAAISGIIATIAAEPEPSGFSETLSAERITAWMRRLGDQGCVYVAAIDGTIAAFGALDFNTEEPETATIGVWVLKEYRRRGLATEIGEYLIEFAREAGYKRVRGRLPDRNEPALAFLSSVGALVPMRNPEMRFELPI